MDSTREAPIAKDDIRDVLSALGPWQLTLKVMEMVKLTRRARAHHVNSYLDANDREVGLSTRYSSFAMAVEDILWVAKPLLSLPIPRVDFRRYEADV